MAQISLSDEQRQHLANILLSCERWAKTEAMIESVSNLGYMNKEAEVLKDRSLRYNNFMWQELEVLCGETPDTLDLYSMSDDVDKI